MTPSIKQRIEQIQCREVPEGYSMERAILYPNDWGTPVRLNTILWENKTRNEDMCYDKKDVLSVSGEQGIVNQIELMGRSYAGESVASYHVVETSDIVYTKSPLKDNPYGIIKQNKGKPGIVSTLYAVYHCKNPIIGQYIENYFSIDTNLNNYLKPLVKRGAKNDMKVNNEDVLLGRIPLPRIEEQQRINVVIAQVDHIIELKQKLVDELKRLKKVCLEKMFPQEGSSVPEIRFPGFTENWEKRRLEDVTIEFKSGVFIAASEIEKAGSYPVYGGNGLRGYAERFNHDGEFALIGRQGALCGNINYSTGKAYFTEHAIAVKANASADTRFLFYILCKMNLGQYSDQSAQPGLAVGKLVKLANLFPSLKEQMIISGFFTNIDDLITYYQHELEEEKKKKKALMQLLLTGIVRVK